MEGERDQRDPGQLDQCKLRPTDRFSSCADVADGLQHTKIDKVNDHFGTRQAA